MNILNKILNLFKISSHPILVIIEPCTFYIDTTIIFPFSNDEEEYISFNTKDTKEKIKYNLRNKHQLLMLLNIKEQDIITIKEELIVLYKKTNDNEQELLSSASFFINNSRVWYSKNPRVKMADYCLKHFTDGYIPQDWTELRISND